MSGVNSLGDLAYEMENIYEGVCQKRYQRQQRGLFCTATLSCDRIAEVVDNLKIKDVL